MRVIVDMPDEMVAQLDELARAAGMSRAWIVRHAVEQSLLRRSGKASDSLIADRRAEALRELATQYDEAYGGREAPMSDVAAVSAQIAAETIAEREYCPGFTPAKGNALRCATCGQRKADH